MWSPQHYQKIGKSKGISQSVLLEAIRQIEEVQTTSHLLQPILTLNHLAILSCTDVDTLRSYVTRTAEETYRHFKIRKRSGGYRRISVPVPMLNVAQSWMAHWVLRNAKPHHSSKAFCPGDSIVKCARVHTNSKWLIKIDIADFFGSITEIQVYRAFRHLGYNPLISFEMTRICTEKVNKSDKYTLKSWQSKERKYSIPGYSQSVLGRLPQGAPTSPMLSNLICQNLFHSSK